MSTLTLTKIRMRNGVWEGRIDGTKHGAKPAIVVRYLDQPVEDVSLAPIGDGDAWSITITVPKQALADGVHTFLISDEGENRVLGSFTLIVDETLADDLRAEVGLLRAELDMLKRAFRRHCLETT
ncbi:hypothetical protein [Jhaorihella thermophila]|uniref:Uncharacterized protein n=1 Tax=Jhaorihella thermophila TaxID=488547 RepID=A0A1H5U7Q4_9RHOB|nr:hypothetical protein [Jhaorihella thermophila]SEF70297.1 hypothetical protein SAMN05421751_103224 [Jhaorihella thermophila]